MSQSGENSKINELYTKLASVRDLQGQYSIPGCSELIMQSNFAIQKKILQIIDNNNKIQTQDVKNAFDNNNLHDFLREYSVSFLITQFLNALDDNDYIQLFEDIQKPTIAVFMNQDCLSYFFTQFNHFYLSFKPPQNNVKVTNFEAIFSNPKVNNIIKTSYELELKVFKYASSYTIQNSADSLDLKIYENINQTLMPYFAEENIQFVSFFALLEHAFGASTHEQILTLSTSGENVLLRKIGLSANMRSLKLHRRSLAQLRQLSCLSISFIGLLLNSLGIISLENLGIYTLFFNYQKMRVDMRNFNSTSKEYDLYEDLLDPINMFFNEEFISYQRKNYNYEEEIIQKILHNFYSIKAGQIETTYEYVPFELLDIVLKEEEKRDNLGDIQNRIVSKIKKIFHRIVIELIKYFVENQFLKTSKIYDLYDEIDQFLNNEIILDQGKGALLGLLDHLKTSDSKMHSIDDMFINMFPYGVFQRVMFDSIHKEKVIKIVLKIIQESLGNEKEGTPGYQLFMNIEQFLTQKQITKQDYKISINYLKNMKIEPKIIDISTSYVVMFDQSRIFTIIAKNQSIQTFTFKDQISFASQLVTQQVNLDYNFSAAQLLQKLPVQIQTSSNSIQQLIKLSQQKTKENILEREGLAFLDSPPSFFGKNVFQCYSFKDYFQGALVSVLEKRILWSIYWQLKNQKRFIFDNPIDIDNYYQKITGNFLQYNNTLINIHSQKIKQLHYKNISKMILWFQNYLVQQLICQYNYEINQLVQYGQPINYYTLINHLYLLDFADTRRKDFIDQILDWVSTKYVIKQTAILSNYYYLLLKYTLNIVNQPIDQLSGYLYQFLSLNNSQINLDQFDDLLQLLKQNALLYKTTDNPNILEKDNQFIQILYQIINEQPFQIYLDLLVQSNIDQFKKQIDTQVDKNDINIQKFQQVLKQYKNNHICIVIDSKEFSFNRYLTNKSTIQILEKLRQFINENFIKLIITSLITIKNEDLDIKHNRNQFLLNFYFILINLQFYSIKDQQHAKQIQQIVSSIQLKPDQGQLAEFVMNKEQADFLQNILTLFTLNSFDQFCFCFINSKFQDMIFLQEKKIKLAMDKQYKKIIGLVQNKQAQSEIPNPLLDNFIDTFYSSLQSQQNKITMIQLDCTQLEQFLSLNKIEAKLYEQHSISKQSNIILELAQNKIKEETSKQQTQQEVFEITFDPPFTEIVQTDQEPAPIPVRPTHTPKLDIFTNKPIKLNLPTKPKINLNYELQPSSSSSSFILDDITHPFQPTPPPNITQTRILPQINFTKNLVVQQLFEPSNAQIRSLFSFLTNPQNRQISLSLLPLDPYSLLCYFFDVEIGTIFLPFQPIDIDGVQDVFNALPELQIAVAGFIFIFPQNEFFSEFKLKISTFGNQNLAEIFSCQKLSTDVIRIFSFAGISMVNLIDFLNQQFSNVFIQVQVYTLKVEEFYYDQNGEFGGGVMLSCGHAFSSQKIDFEKKICCAFCGRSSLPMKGVKGMGKVSKNGDLDELNLRKYGRDVAFESPVLIVNDSGAFLRPIGEFGYNNQFLDYYLD